MHTCIDSKALLHICSYQSSTPSVVIPAGYPRRLAQAGKARTPGITTLPYGQLVMHLARHLDPLYPLSSCMIATRCKKDLPEEAG